MNAHRHGWKRKAAAFVLALLAACVIEPAEERALLDDVVGRGSAGGVRFRVEGGLAGIRNLSPGQIELWLQAPAVRIAVEAAPGAVTAWTITARNAVTDAALVFAGNASGSVRALGAGATANTLRWQTELPSGASSLLLGPPDVGSRSPWTFAVLSDVQEAIGDVGDIWARMAEDPEIRFVVSTGDLTEQGEREELLAFQASMAALPVPLYSTVGNHELGVPPDAWHALFGPFNFQFLYRDVAFTFVDSASATVDPRVYDRLDRWLQGARERYHVFVTHEPILDPVGERNGGFRSRKEAGKLLRMLAVNQVDLLFFGHIHSFYAYSLGGTETYISGGGGAIPERLDGIGRHYLRVTVDPVREEAIVSVVRVDP